MLRVAVHNIEPGMVLARPIPHPQNPHKFLLQRDHEIPSSMVPRLKELGVLEVWIRYRNLEFLEDIIDVELGEQQREIYAQVRSNFETIMQDATAAMDMRHFESSIGGLFHFLKENAHGNVLLQKLDAYDNYLMSHSTNVCYLALLLGMKLEQYLIKERTSKKAQDAKDIQLLGLGCLLHDVGKMRVPKSILDKPVRLTDDEMEVMKQHTLIGFDMVKGRVAPIASQIVLNHHQRYDGGGYPERFDSRTGDPLPPLAAKQIPVFSRIATVVDVYDAATSARVYSSAKPPVQVLHEMRTWCKGFFDPVIEQAFYEIIPPFPIGQMVMLTNGVEAAVIDFNPRCPTRPKVQGITDPYGQQYDDPSLEEIDLALYPELEIESVDGKDIREYLPSQQTLPQMV
ncbi:MAG: HD-GYP domain-containing protein [Pirellulales bacterium]|nr:HD-GYP domain-containing protein [Pirellulales bacterium]